MPLRTHFIQIRLSDQERKELKALADSQGLSMSAYARMLFKEKLQQQKKEK